MITCPVCEIAVEIPAPSRIGEVLECTDCRSDLEIVALDPVMLAMAPVVDEDWGE